MTPRKTPVVTKKKTAQTKTKSSPAHRRPQTVRDIHCADFVGGDQHNITYGFAAKDVEALIEKVLAFIKEGAVFEPTRGDVVEAKLDGQTLTFRPGAITRLAGQRNVRSYLLSLTVRQDYLVWATKFIPLAAKVDKRNVAGLQMPVAYSAFRTPREGEGGQATYEQLEDITQALHEHNAFVILGEPGAGKTTTLQKVAFESARALLSGGAGRTPLFVRLSQQHAHDPFEFLQKEWEQRTGTYFADALAQGQVLVLADGLNEIARDERDGRLKDWRLFVEEYRGANQILFTGREKDYESQLDLPRVRVDPLDTRRIADYLQRQEAQGLGTQVADEQAPLYKMARNPFNLSLLVHAYLSNQRDIGNRGYLLEWFAGELFGREEKLAHRWWLPRAVQVRALAQLAFAMQNQGEGTTFSIKTAKAALPTTYEVDGDDLALRAEILIRCARAATLLDPALDDVRFYHHLLQEYFAALELLRRFAEGEDLSGLWKSKRLIAEMPPTDVGEWDALPEPPPTGWEVTTLLAVGLSPDPARLIEAVRPHNPNLAGRCILESGVDQSRVSLRSVQSQTQHDLLNELYNPALHLRARLQAGFTLGRLGNPRFAPTSLNGVSIIVPQMVNVPAGQYAIGSDDSDPQAFNFEKPQHTVDLPAFAIGRWPVTNAEYACFIEAGGYKDERWWTTDLSKRWLKGEEVTGGQSHAILNLWRVIHDQPDTLEQVKASGIYSPDQQQALDAIAAMSEDQIQKLVNESLNKKSREQPGFWNDTDRNNPSQPVVGITWFEAKAYCEWLTHINGKPYRLPTEVEWEAAARGPSTTRSSTLPVVADRSAQGEVRVYPWGNDFDSTKANTIEGRVLKPSSVGAYTAAGNVGPFGTEDGSGNVWNWTSSINLPYPYNHADGREDENAEGERIVRGGSWYLDSRYARCASRNRNVPDFFDYNIGFRLLSPVS